VCHRLRVSVVRFSRFSSSVEQTRTIAGELARLLRGGDVVLLIGELGAGKTAFTQGLGAALGVSGEITSPTFTIMREYEVTLPAGGPATFLHLDAYRLSGSGATDDIGLFERLDEGAFAVIEWGDIVAGAFGDDPLVIEFFWESDHERTVVFSAAPNGPWTPRLVGWLGTPGAGVAEAGAGAEAGVGAGAECSGVHR